MSADLEATLRRFAAEQDRLAPAVSAEEAVARASSRNCSPSSGSLRDDERFVADLLANASDSGGAAGAGRRRWGRLMLLSGAAVLVVAFSLTALGSLTSSKTRVSTSPPMTPAPAPSTVPPAKADGAAANEGAARVEAARLAGLFRPGPQWVDATAPPVASLQYELGSLGRPNVIDVSRFWTSSESWADVRAWISANPPISPTAFGSSAQGHSRTSATPGGSPTTYQDVYILPSIANLFSEREVGITTAPTADGKIGVRLDGQVTWLPPRPRTETAPSSTAAVTVAAYLATPDRVIARRTFTDTPTISALAASVNGLSVTVRGTDECVNDIGLRLAVTFTTSDPAKTVIVAANPACSTSTFTLGAANELPLEIDRLTDQEADLLGTTMPSLSAKAQARAKSQP
jgi:hypothetical protein